MWVWPRSDQDSLGGHYMMKEKFHSQVTRRLQAVTGRLAWREMPARDDLMK